MSQSPTRRAFLSLLPASRLALSAERGLVIASEFRRYPDPATEFTALRLTDPAHTSVLPASYGRALGRHGNSLLYANDRTGEFQAYRMDLKSGQSHQLTTVEGLVPRSLTMLPDEKTAFFVAGRVVYSLAMANLRDREIYQIPDGFDPGDGFSVSDDGLYAALVEKRPGAYRLRLISLSSGSATTVVESAEEIADPEPRPKRAGILYRLGGRELHVVNYDGQQNQRLRTTPGGLGPALWSQDGRTVEYLNFPDDRKQLNNVREFVPDANEDRALAPTTQFVSFGRNSDSSVFVGASGSKVTPYVLLLVRRVKRELTLCEHKASDPSLVAPIFSPNSQRVFFQTDRHGKLAIYSMSVERLVEETE